MKSTGKKLFFLVLIIGLFFGFQTENPQILIRTELGDIILEIFTNEAPMTSSHFLKCIDEHLFQEASFYRKVTLDNQPQDEVKIEVIQGGIRYSSGKKVPPPIEHETTETTGILHKDGVLSMARSSPGTASSEFFICVGDQPELDFGGKRNPDGQGFSSFGRVIKGMEVVQKIHKAPESGQLLDPRIKIFDIIRNR
jgi:peptidyl-prolyl cis-trans isomerase A (cyclophilin A)